MRQLNETLWLRRLRVNSYGIATDNQVFNLVRVERGQEFLEVVHEHRALVPSIDTALARCDFANTRTPRPSLLETGNARESLVHAFFVALHGIVFKALFRDNKTGRCAVESIVRFALASALDRGCRESMRLSSKFLPQLQKTARREIVATEGGERF